jgi:hypothetical protein
LYRFPWSFLYWYQAPFVVFYMDDDA